ncbi:MAG: C-terminal helicase domain-containing protein, partial [Candidatus Woesearchaeota archaeon]
KNLTSTKLYKELMEQYFYDVPQHQKFSLLVHLIKEERPQLAMVFCGTRRGADLVGRNLVSNNINAKTLHGGLSQNKRSRFMDDFKKGNIHVLVVTDVAARGLDVKNVTHVFNYDIPRDPSNYIHRIGRTARAGEKGKAISLLSHSDYDFFRAIDTVENGIQKLEIGNFPKVPFIKHVENRRHFSHDPRRESHHEPRGHFSHGHKGHQSRR